MDRRRAEIERSLRREQYPKVEPDPRLIDLARRRGRWGRPPGDGLEPAPAEPRGGGGLGGGAAATIEPDRRR